MILSQLVELLKLQEKLIEMSGGKVAAFIFVINLFDLGGSDNLVKNKYKVENLMDFPGH
jgi:adenine phosphoribosyltransferase